ncbi:precorrin-6y C5,15-methyltransferase (decarboxylating) subunit CbiE [Clostridium aminobutyricum]|uniref:Precorrin-6y C5,15-methyltransferase (Decarboxylating) subunit CbiE n=1 Tax=Clostridium aminobutyricum TaxID=33953 RepID=A0A939IIB6_CLOAM|nr:precorrin-6y C5,15-methyltransferase (decarboxylating) subunit CbiE [Clostridium aminobutyricum]MBN7772393.1 precorrin-6y C5,15-methyltransferase (decarboxylating) subunit CbiE [Clostridium aminobutyricum]
MKKLYIIGIGMGNPNTITVKGKEIIRHCEALIGAKRMVDSFALPNQEYCYAITPSEILNWIEEKEPLQSVAILMSGDIGFFSGAKKLRDLITERYGETGYRDLFHIEGIPGISSLSYFTAKIGLSWDDVKVVSLHGREGSVIGTVQRYEKTFFLTDGAQHSVQNICGELSEAGLGQVLVYVGERLSYEDEKVTVASADELKAAEFDALSVILVENSNFVQREKETIGLSDDDFIRGNVPMTKEEVRTLTVSKLNLQSDDVIYDIGAGTGSVSIELSLVCQNGHVYAVEENEEAIELIKRNQEKFCVKNLHIIKGLAPQALAELPIPNKAFIGGSKGNLEEILCCLMKRNPAIRLAINAISLDTLSETLACLKKYPFKDIEITQVNISKSKTLGNHHLMIAQNPVYIICGTAKAELL